MKTHHLSAPGIASIKKFQDRGLAENRRSEIPETTKDDNKKNNKPPQPKPENGDKNFIIVGWFFFVECLVLNSTRISWPPDLGPLGR